MHTATTEIITYLHTLSLHDSHPISNRNRATGVVLRRGRLSSSEIEGQPQPRHWMGRRAARLSISEIEGQPQPQPIGIGLRLRLSISEIEGQPQLTGDLVGCRPRLSLSENEGQPNQRTKRSVEYRERRIKGTEDKINKYPQRI